MSICFEADPIFISHLVRATKSHHRLGTHAIGRIQSWASQDAATGLAWSDQAMNIGLVHLKPWVVTQMGEEQGFVIQVVMILWYFVSFCTIDQKKELAKDQSFFWCTNGRSWPPWNFKCLTDFLTVFFALTISLWGFFVSSKKKRESLELFKLELLGDWHKELPYKLNLWLFTTSHEPPSKQERMVVMHVVKSVRSADTGPWQLPRYRYMTTQSTECCMICKSNNAQFESTKCSFFQSTKCSILWKH